MSQWDDVSVADFGGDTMAVVAETIGIEPTKKLIEAFGGEMIYVPKAESVVREGRDRRIYEEFDGVNYRELSKKYNLTTGHVRKIIHEQRLKKPKGQYRQDELF